AEIKFLLHKGVAFMSTFINHSFSHVTFNKVSFSWPDGTACLRELSGTFSSPLTGLIGDNGSGKSTLLKLILGQYSPTSGSIERPENIGYLPQDLGLKTAATIADVFGVADVLDAIAKVESRRCSEELPGITGEDRDADGRMQK